MQLKKYTRINKRRTPVLQTKLRCFPFFPYFLENATRFFPCAPKMELGSDWVALKLFRFPFEQ